MQIYPALLYPFRLINDWSLVFDNSFPTGQAPYFICFIYSWECTLKQHLKLYWVQDFLLYLILLLYLQSPFSCKGIKLIWFKRLLITNPMLSVISPILFKCLCIFPGTEASWPCPQSLHPPSQPSSSSLLPQHRSFETSSVLTTVGLFQIVSQTGKWKVHQDQ